MPLRVLFALAALTASSLCAAELRIRGQAFLLDGQPFDMWGIRTASASQSDALTRQLVGQLEEYRRHGVNTVSVYYMGSSASYSDPFSPDGTAIDAAHQRRMAEIIGACDRRGMVVVVGVFYQRANPPRLRDWDAAQRAVVTVTRALKPYRNVILNIANEQNSSNYERLPWSRVRLPADVLSLARLAKAEDPTRLVGAGGYLHDSNEVIGRSADIDVLLFDTNGPEPSAELYRRFRAAGVNKPMVNVETFGAWTNRFLPQGVFPDHVKETYWSEVRAAARHEGLYLHFHNSPWLQATGPGSHSRYDLGGDGTSASPGIGWYFAAVAKARGLSPQAPRQAAPIRFPGSEWAHRVPELVGMDNDKLSAALAAIPHRGNVAVVRDGFLTAWTGDIRDSSINLYSACKSITALVCARLLQLGKVTLDETLPRSDYPSGPRATYRQFLSMTSDYDLSPHEPGRHYAYNNVAVRFYGEHMRLRHFPGLSAAETLQAALFDAVGHEDPISITRAPSVYGSPWAGGQKMSARDLARLGLLVLARGKWAGQQVIPAEFCDSLFRVQLPAEATPSQSRGTESPANPNAESNQDAPTRAMAGSYSFGWWCNESGRLGPNLPREIAYASGRGGNYLIVVRPWNVVIAVTNDVPDEQYRPPITAYLNAVRSALHSSSE